MRSIARIYYFLNPYHNVELNTFQALQGCNMKKKKKKEGNARKQTFSSMGLHKDYQCFLVVIANSFLIYLA